MEKKEQKTMHDLAPYESARKSLSLREKIGQHFMPAAFINDSEEEISKLERLIRNFAIGGLCFFHSRASAATNFEGKKEVIYNAQSLDILKQLIARYQAAAPYPLLIAIDAEWGLAMRIENTPRYPYAITLGALREKEELIREVGFRIGLDCREAQIHWNFAPVADINNNPDNPVIGYRSFGEDRHLVSTKAIAFMGGLQMAGILTSAKHFPGHGDTATDSHLGLPLIDKSEAHLKANELYPFKELIRHGVDSVMVGHLAVPALTKAESLPTSISERTIKKVLRKELDFEGLVVSDALNMRAISELAENKGELEWLALDAGNDMLCFAENIEEGIDFIAKNASTAQIDESFGRIWKLKQKAFQAAALPLPTVRKNHERLLSQLAKHSLTFYKGNTSLLEAFRSNPFAGLSIGPTGETEFFRTLKKEYSFQIFHSSTGPLAEPDKDIYKQQQILIALAPPKVKPQNNFDLPSKTIQLINQLAAEKQVVLYLFGNPYVLNILDYHQMAAVVIAYEDFGIFQENAAHHFTGKVSAQGKLPVKLKDTSE